MAKESKVKVSDKVKRVSKQETTSENKKIASGNGDKKIRSKESPSAKDKASEGYESVALSKKDRRKLKKMQALVESESDKHTSKGHSSDSEEASVGEGNEESDEELDLEKLAASESESDVFEDEEEEDSDEDDGGEDSENELEEEEEEEELEDVPLSDVEIDSDADIVPHTKLTINNTAALKDSLARIALPWAKHSFQEHQSVVSNESVEPQIKDIYDDTERELAFYKQGLEAVKIGRTELLKLKVPFSRPMDYFAEMIKNDEHMDKLKSKLLTEAANKKASQEAKKQRSLKKFGKQVQVATLQERAKQKRETLDKIKSLRKRGANQMDDDDFQIALEEATQENDRSNKRQKPNGKRLSKDAKYGFGGKKRGTRRNDATSSADVSAFSAKKMKGKSSRPGKSKRSRRN